MKRVYGPVASWRLGASLGIDPLCTAPKVCTFDCRYCQLGSVPAVPPARREFVPAEEIARELHEALECVAPDVITLSGTGEPTLAANLDAIIAAIRAETTLPVALLTNGSLLRDPSVRHAVAGLDIVAVKLDAPDEATFARVNRPAPGVTHAGIVAGIRALRAEMTGRLALQIMLVRANQPRVADLAELARALAPDEVQLNTPLRESAEPPLTPAELTRAAQHFAGLEVHNVYDAPKAHVAPLDAAAVAARGKVLDEREVARRRPGRRGK